MRVAGLLALASLQRLWSRVGREQQKRPADFGMSRVPSAQLHDVEEQEAASRPCDLQEILSRLQDSHAPQRDEIVRGVKKMPRQARAYFASEARTIGE